MLDRKKLAKNMRSFALRKPGFDLADYAGYYNAYRRDYYSYKKDADFNRDFSTERLEGILEMCSDDEIKDAFKAFSGRLSFDENMELHYCSGQYYPTEYQCALRCVIERLLYKEV
jgi:hypothetical protein